MYRKIFLFFSIGLILSKNLLFAATTATAVINYTIAAIDSIAISPTTYTLNIGAATAGTDPTDATSTGTMSYTTNGTARRITASITTGTLPTGVTLRVNITPPVVTGGGTSAGNTIIPTAPATAVALVTGISNVAVASATTVFTLSATSAAAPTTGTPAVTVTFTIGT